MSENLHFIGVIYKKAKEYLEIPPEEVTWLAADNMTSLPSSFYFGVEMVWAKYCFSLLMGLLPLSSPICRIQAERSRQPSVPSVFMTFYKIHADGRKEFVSSL